MKRIAICLVGVFFFQPMGSLVGFESYLIEGEAALQLAENERVVTSFAELKSALAMDNGISTVYLGANITMQLGGISLPAKKEFVEIVGLNPLTPEQTEPYTLTDYSSAAFTDTIYVSNSGVKDILVRDINLVGKNFYGSVSALDSSLTSELMIRFERVTYNGPQIGFHRTGRLKFTDCTVRITGENGGSVRQEFSEAKHLYFDGVNTIDTETQAYTVFWLPLGGSFQVMDGASLTVRSPNTSTAYGLFYAGATANKIAISIGEGAVCRLYTATTVAPTIYSTISELTVKQDGELYINATKAILADVLSVGGDLNVGEGAVFKIEADGGSTQSVIAQRNGDIHVEKNAVFQIIASKSYASLINLYGCSLSLNDPESVVLSNDGKRVLMATNRLGKIYLHAEQINLWDENVPSSIHNLPTYHWKMKDDSNVTIQAELGIGSNGKVDAIESNFISEDVTTVGVDAVTFNLLSTRILSLGRLPLHVITPVPASTVIVGVTIPDATVMARVIEDDEELVMPEVVSSKSGHFSIPMDKPFAAGQGLTVYSHYQYLFATKVVSVVPVGWIEAIIPDTLSFFPMNLNKQVEFVNRVDDDWGVLVSDNRGAGHKWKLYAKTVKPLTPADQTKPALENALVFRMGDETIPLKPDEMVLIQEHTSTSDAEQKNVQWRGDQGVLVEMPSGVVYSNMPYTGRIEWVLVEAP